jgi:Cu2+-exporting ATPase
MTDYTLTIPTMVCNNCTGPIKQAIKSISKLSEQSLNITFNFDHSGTDQGGKVTLTLPKEDPELVNQIIEEIEDCGHEVSSHSISSSKQHFLKALISGGFGLLQLGLMLSGIAMPTLMMPILGGLSMMTLWYSGKDIFRLGLMQPLKTGILTMETLFTLSTLTAIALSLAAFFIPGLHFEFSTALLILGSHHLGKHIENKLKQKINYNLSAKSQLPKMVNKIKSFDIPGDNKFIATPIEAIMPGDVIHLTKGMRFPCDGVLLSDKAVINTKFYTGNNNDVFLIKDAKVYAGTRVEEGTAIIKATASLKNSEISEHDIRLKNSIEKKTNIEKATTKVIQYFVPGVILASTLTFFVASPIFGISVGLHAAMAILVGACPCTLGFIAPLTMQVGINKIAKDGALINNPDSIENTKNINNIIFDLNGTLTEGRPAVKTIHFLTDISEEQALYYIYHLESALEKKHQIGDALKNHAVENLAQVPKPPQSMTLEKNSKAGIVGKINHNTIILGNYYLMKLKGIDIKDPKPQRIYLAKNRTLIAIIDMHDPIHPDAKSTLDVLRSLGKNIILCTGADRVTANAYAKALNITTVKSECHGGIAKEKFINSLQTPCCMVGDGENDALPIKAATIGIAMNNSDELSKHCSDIQIRSNGLRAIPNFFEHAKQVLSVVKQNLAISLIYNICVACLTAWIAIGLGPMAPGFMALSMGLQSMIILANTYRLKEKPLSTSMNASDDIQLLNFSISQPTQSVNPISPNRQPKPSSAKECDQRLWQKPQDSTEPSLPSPPTRLI